MTVNITNKGNGKVSITKSSEKVISTESVQETVTVKGGARGETGPQGPQGIQGIQGIQGPQGDEGIVVADSAPDNTDVLWLDTTDTSTAALAATVLSDFVSPYSYIGVAVSGSSQSAAVWRITRINVGPPVTTTVATNIAWTNRLSGVYS